MIDVAVSRKTVEADGICSFELVPVVGGTLPPFRAGAHIDVEVGRGFTRQYSLCNHPDERHRYLICVLRDPATRGGSAAMHDTVIAGSTIRIGEPKNHFPLQDRAQCSVLLAGGIGVTPLLAMAESLNTAGSHFEMHYCTRSPMRTAFRDRIAGSRFADRVRFYFDDGPEEHKFDIAKTLRTPDPGTHLYVCGPTGFMDAVIATARNRGWPESHVHFEYFAGGEVSSADDKSFEVELRRSGKVIRVEPAQTVIEALASQGIEVPTGCQQGVCGTCLTRVLDGIPEHRDMYFTSEEHAANDQFLPCCSRAKTSRLVLDL